MAAKGGKKGTGKKGANGYKLPDPITAGEVLTDLGKKQWIIGKSIGVGGFGEIYSAAPYSGKIPKDYPAVIKIEPHGNGPLFVEMHFYMRNSKPDDIEIWKKKKKLSSLGMPQFNGSGSHEYKGIKYRFVVMDRYGTDLWKLFVENNRKFPEVTVYRVAVQIINVLEYIHSKTYIHADIKGANLLLDLKTGNQVYLVDFGLASHYTSKTEYKLDPKKAHNGTIEYTSRDAHMGVPTMRSDFEILGYNIIQWLCGYLPWEKNLKDPSSVQKQKEKAFEDIKGFLKDCFDNQVPTPIIQYMSLLEKLEFNSTPNYDKFREILVSGLQKLGQKLDGPLVFNGELKKLKAPDVTPQKTKKTSDTPNRRKSPRIKPSRDASPKSKKARSPSPPHPSLDDSCVGVVVDKKREKLKDMQKILATIDDDSDTEYDIMITKKRKVPKVEEKIPTVPSRKVPVRRGRKNIIEDDETEPEVIPRGTRSRKVATKIISPKIATKQADSDEDIFDD